MHGLISSLFPESASNLAPEVDRIFFALVALCGAVTFLVMALIIFFGVRYRRGSKASRAGKKLSSGLWETTWTFIPLLIFIGIFIWAAKAYFHMLTPPADVAATYVVAKQWMWKIQHGDGRREINELHIPLGRPVKLVMTSEDVIHDFFVPAFRTKQDVVPGRYTTIWFIPTKPGNTVYSVPSIAALITPRWAVGFTCWSRRITRDGSLGRMFRFRSRRRVSACFTRLVAVAATRKIPKFTRRCC